VTVLEAGQTVDRYEVREFVGEGGMAMVYRAKHRILGSDHALKVMTNIHPSYQDRLLREGRAQSSLSHMNIVHVSDVLRIGDSLALVMDWVEGMTLREWLAYNSPSIDEALHIFRGIVRGVRHAHAHGVVHRDLKPGNVLMEETEKGPVPKVADFGLAKVQMDDPSGDPETYTLWDDRIPLTRSGAALGTPEYMAPEQVRDAAKVDARADLFSLGCILYELACGKQAFSGDVVDVYKAVTDGRYVPPEEIVPDLPDAVVVAIHSLLSVDADARLATCDQLLALLDPPAIPSVPPTDPARDFAPPAGASGRSAEIAILPLVGPMTGIVVVAFLLAWLL
jgi:eukaryotic-like serine/threonine-protein kinase